MRDGRKRGSVGAGLEGNSCVRRSAEKPTRYRASELGRCGRPPTRVAVPSCSRKGHGRRSVTLPGRGTGEEPPPAILRHNTPRSKTRSQVGACPKPYPRLRSAVWSLVAEDTCQTAWSPDGGPEPGPSLVRGTRRNEGPPRIITDTDPAAHGPSCQLDRRAFCRLQRRGHGSPGSAERHLL